MLVEEPVLLNLEKSAEKLNQLYSLDERFSEFELCKTPCYYSIGISNIKDSKKVL